MWSKLSKNGIVKGPMESFCLVCECLVGDVVKIDKHIDDPYHEKRLGMYLHLEKYTKDRIRKIKAVYLCEFCSVVLNTATKVNAHISSREHINNRGLQQLTAGPESGVVAFNEVLISEDAWHAVGDNCCSLCSEEDVDSKHKHSPNHLFKFVQSKIEFLENGLYRKVDESTVQCLTCNILFDVNLINNHFDSEDHKVVFTKCKIQGNNLNGEIKTLNGNNLGIPKSNTGKKSDDQQDAVSETEEIKKYSKDNKITYNLGHDTAYCRVCEIRMPASLRSMKEHVSDMFFQIKHVNKLKSTTPKLKTTPSKVFLKDLTNVQNLFCHDMVINMKICIPFSSFLMITKNSEHFTCLACEQNFSEDFLQEHIKISRHLKAMEGSSVVTTFDNEFLREIRPGIYHCGFCNELVTKWDDVPSHLESADHKFKKGTCQYRLSQHLPEIRENREQKQIQQFLMMRMLEQGLPFPFMFN